MAKKSKTPSTSATPVVVETKEQKLIRLATSRVAKACKSISLIGNLAAYRPTEKDVDTIMEALGATCAGVENRLRGVQKGAKPFSLRTIPASQG